MVVHAFLAWMHEATALERAEAVQVFAEAYLAGALGEETLEDIETALTSILDDTSVLVRRTLAIAFADRSEVPRHLVVSLAQDQSEVSALLVARSPLLTDVDLIDIAPLAQRLTLIAIALRPSVSARVSRAVIERADPYASRTLLLNPCAEIEERDLIALADQPGQGGSLRQAMLKRPGLPLSVRYQLMEDLANELGAYAVGAGFLSAERQSRLRAEAVQAGALILARAEPQALAPFVAHLRLRGALTAALLLRGLLCGNLALMATAIVELSGLSPAKVAAHLSAASAASLAALLRRAGFPITLEPILIAAIKAAARLGDDVGSANLSRAIIGDVLKSAAAIENSGGAAMIALLRRLDAEAARAQSRLALDRLRESAAREAQERMDQERVNQERLEQERLEQERLEQERRDLEQQALAHAGKDASQTSSASNLVLFEKRGTLAIPAWADDDLYSEAAPVAHARSSAAEIDLRDVITQWKKVRDARSALPAAHHPARTLSDDAPTGRARYG